MARNRRRLSDVLDDLGRGVRVSREEDARADRYLRAEESLPFDGLIPEVTAENFRSFLVSGPSEVEAREE